MYQGVHEDYSPCRVFIDMGEAGMHCTTTGTDGKQGCAVFQQGQKGSRDALYLNGRRKGAGIYHSKPYAGTEGEQGCAVPQQGQKGSRDAPYHNRDRRGAGMNKKSSFPGWP